MADTTTRAAYARGQRAAKQAQGLPEDDERHGTFNAYSNLGCRCSRCRAANAAHVKSWRTK